MIAKFACIPNFSFLGELEVTCPGGWGGWVGGFTVIIGLVSVQVKLHLTCPLELSLAKLKMGMMFMFGSVGILRYTHKWAGLDKV